jgi:hypothetical protein
MGRSKRSAITASANGLETLLFDAIGSLVVIIV